MSTLFLTLLDMSISASYIIAFIILLRFFMKKTPKYIFCILWGIVAFRLICPFSFESSFSLLPRKQLISNEENIVVKPQDVSNEYNYWVENDYENLDNNTNINMPYNENRNEISSINDTDNTFYIIDFIWGLGVTSIILYSIVSYIVLKKKVSDSIKLKDNIFICDNIETPFTFGIIKPKVYIPSDMKQTEQSYVLLHEKAHIKRMDNLWKPLGFVILSVHWFNPLVWVAFNLFCKDIEFATDEKVIKKLNEDGKKEYSEILLSFSLKKSQLVSTCPVAFGENNVKERISMIVKYKKVSIFVVVISILVCLITAVCFLTNPKTKETINKETDIYTENNNILDEDILPEMNQRYKAILLGNRDFVNIEHSDKDIRLNIENIKDVVSDEEGVTAKVTKFAIIDLDGNGENELVLWIQANESSDYGFEILYLRNEEVYGFTLPYRAFQHLKTDGTFYLSGGIDNRGIRRLILLDRGYTIEEVVDSESQEEKTDVTWYDLNSENTDLNMETAYIGLVYDDNIDFGNQVGIGIITLDGKKEEVLINNPIHLIKKNNILIYTYQAENEITYHIMIQPALYASVVNNVTSNSITLENGNEIVFNEASEYEIAFLEPKNQNTEDLDYTYNMYRGKLSDIDKENDLVNIQNIYNKYYIIVYKGKLKELSKNIPDTAITFEDFKLDRLIKATGKYYENITGNNVNKRISEEKAIEIAKEHIGTDGKNNIKNVEAKYLLYTAPDKTQTPVILVIFEEESKKYDTKKTLINVDADTGEVIRLSQFEYNKMDKGTVDKGTVLLSN